MLHNFVQEYNKGNNEGNYTRWTYRKDSPYIIWYDPSEGKKSVMFFVQVYEGTLRVFDELIIDPCSGSSEAKRELMAFLATKDYSDPAVIVVDPRRVEVVSDLRSSDVCGYSFKARTAPIDAHLS